MNHFYNNLTGVMPIGTFIAALVFSMLGWFLHKFITAKNRNVGSQRTPGKWDWKFWIQDNFSEAIAHFAMLFVAVRFAPDIFRYFAPESLPFFQQADHMAIYFAVGWLVSYPLNKIKKSIKK